MKYFNANKKNALYNLEKVLNARKSKQQNQGGFFGSTAKV